MRSPGIQHRGIVTKSSNWVWLVRLQAPQTAEGLKLCVAAADRSNLVDMAHDTSIQFGEAPPLFARPPGWSAATVSKIKTSFYC